MPQKYGSSYINVCIDMKVPSRSKAARLRIVHWQSRCRQSVILFYALDFFQLTTFRFLLFLSFSFVGSAIVNQQVFYSLSAFDHDRRKKSITAKKKFLFGPFEFVWNVKPTQSGCILVLLEVDQNVSLTKGAIRRVGNFQFVKQAWFSKLVGL